MPFSARMLRHQLGARFYKFIGLEVAKFTYKLFFASDFVTW